jgi:propionyl-CoA synthetase
MADIVLPMPGRPPDAAWLRLGAEPGLCAGCQHAKLNETRRGTAYLRCTRAAWDSRLPRYPRLPVMECVGFDPVSGSLGAEQQRGGGTRGDPPGQRGDEIG